MHQFLTCEIPSCKAIYLAQKISAAQSTTFGKFCDNDLYSMRVVRQKLQNAK